jgi:hypothetical protein
MSDANKTVVTGDFKITFVFQGKQFTTSVYRRQTAYSLWYVIKFKSGNRTLSPENNSLRVHVGKPLEQELLNAIYQAILSQIEPVAEQINKLRII